MTTIQIILQKSLAALSAASRPRLLDAARTALELHRWRKQLLRRLRERRRE